MGKRKLKEIDIHKDYVLWGLNSNARQTVRVLIDYMQARTPYGEAYQKAFEQYKIVMKELYKLEDALAETVEIRFSDNTETE